VFFRKKIVSEQHPLDSVGGCLCYVVSQPVFAKKAPCQFSYDVVGQDAGVRFIASKPL
jgi:hypothetical protein